MNDESKIEIATYSLIKGISEKEFLKAIDKVMADLKDSGSDVGWKLYKGNDDVWVDIVTSQDWARTIEEFKKVLSLPNAQRMYAMIDKETHKYQTLTLQRTYP